MMCVLKKDVSASQPNQLASPNLAYTQNIVKAETKF